MEKKYLIMETTRDAYNLGQIEYTMTVKDLINYLENYGDDYLVVFSNDRGYTYGELRESCFRDVIRRNQ